MNIVRHYNKQKTEDAENPIQQSRLLTKIKYYEKCNFNRQDIH